MYTLSTFKQLLSFNHSLTIGIATRSSTVLITEPTRTDAVVVMLPSVSAIIGFCASTLIGEQRCVLISLGL